jgi:Winged helix-turn helix
MRESMEIYPRTAAERAMKLQEVLLRATAGKIKWWQAAELIGISERQMRRWRKRLEEQGPKGLLDRRRGTPSRWTRPTRFSVSTTSPSSTAALPFRQHSEARHLYLAGTGTWR